jgi:hypothetical protein
MKQATEMGSDAMIYIPSSIKVQAFNINRGRGVTDTDTTFKKKDNTFIFLNISSVG